VILGSGWRREHNQVEMVQTFNVCNFLLSGRICFQLSVLSTQLVQSSRIHLLGSSHESN
jgi:hypothetical protein